MDRLKAIFVRLLDQAAALLQASPARAIGYGGAVVVYIVAKAFGRIPDLSFEDSVALAFSVIPILVAIVETIRAFVYSPATVGRMQ